MQNIIFGFDGEKLRHALREFSVKKFLLVCDGAFSYLNVKDVFENIQMPHVKFDGFSPNPLYEDVVKGVEFFISEKCDGIVAVGGGSAIDVAKCIKLYSGMNRDECFIGQEYKDTKIPLFALPTTAGTGSESTRHAVIYYIGEKQSISHESIVPQVAFLEPSVLETLPLYQKKCTMLDALGQGIESLWSVNSTEESREYSKKAVRLITENLDAYIFENSPTASKSIMEGANLSGRAINITATTAAHAMSYKLSSLYGIPHGHAVAVCLSQVWEYMLYNTDRCSDGRGESHLLKIFDEIAFAMGCESAMAALEKYRSILSKLDISGVEGMAESEFETLSDSVNPVRLKNNPVAIEKDAFKMLYSAIVSFRN